MLQCILLLINVSFACKVWYWSILPFSPRTAFLCYFTFHFIRLKHIQHGYWKIVSEFTDKQTVKNIKHLQHVTTDMGRGIFSSLDLHIFMYHCKNIGTCCIAPVYWLKDQVFSIHCLDKPSNLIHGYRWTFLITISTNHYFDNPLLNRHQIDTLADTAWKWPQLIWKSQVKLP